MTTNTNPICPGARKPINPDGTTTATSLCSQLPTILYNIIFYPCIQMSNCLYTNSHKSESNSPTS